jgi:hypothetical protein
MFQGRPLVSEFERIEDRLESAIEQYINALAEH